MQPIKNELEPSVYEMCILYSLVRKRCIQPWIEMSARTNKKVPGVDEMQSNVDETLRGVDEMQIRINEMVPGVNEMQSNVDEALPRVYEM